MEKTFCAENVSLTFPPTQFVELTKNTSSSISESGSENYLVVAKRMKVASHWLYPTGFALFNICFWVYYLNKQWKDLEKFSQWSLQRKTSEVCRVKRLLWQTKFWILCEGTVSLLSSRLSLMERRKRQCLWIKVKWTLLRVMYIYI